MADPELSAAMTGAWRLAHLDRAGLGHFDDTPHGIWRSFRSAIFVFPGYLLLKALDVPQDAWEHVDILRLFVVATIAYVVVWTAYPLILLGVARWLGREATWGRYIVVYNWIQIPETVVFVVVNILIASPLLPASAAQALVLASVLAVLLYEWFVAKVALEVDGPQAALVVLIGIVLSAAVSRMAEYLYN